MKNCIVGYSLAVLVLGSISNTLNAAATIQFDPTGTGTYTDLASFDISPGNLVNSATSLDQYDDGGVVQAYFQATIAAYQITNGPKPSLLPGGTNGTNEFTVVLGFQQSLTTSSIPNILDAIITSTFVSGGDNYFGIYHDTSADADDLAGTGFASTDASDTLIMSGRVIGIKDTNFIISDLDALETFDQSANGDDYGGLQTIVGSGSFTLTIAIDDYLSGYFSTPPGTVIELSIATGQIVLPFEAVDPSRSMTSSLDGTSSFAPNLFDPNGAPVNGTWLDRQFQVDPSATFEIVPEPASMLVWGGLASALGLGGLIRRRKK